MHLFLNYFKALFFNLTLYYFYFVIFIFAVCIIVFIFVMFVLTFIYFLSFTSMPLLFYFFIELIYYC